MVSEAERLMLCRVPRRGEGHGLKVRDISDEHPSASRVLSGLYRKEYVKRYPAKGGYAYFLTDKGEKEVSG